MAEFLADKKKINIRKVRMWARQNNYTKKEVENMLATFALRYAAFLLGGESKGDDPNNLLSQEVKHGIKVEYEHTNIFEDSRKIAIDHLTEFQSYYVGLSFMEKMLNLLEKENKLSYDAIKESLNDLYKFMENIYGQKIK